MLAQHLTRALLFHPTRGQSRRPDELGMPYEEHWITAEDGVRTQAWHIPAPNARVLMPFFHGNAGVMADRLENLRLIHRLGVSLLAVEYRGYGDSEGRPSEAGLRADALAALALARTLADGGKVVPFGRSLGGAVAIDLASRAKVDGLIAEATFTSLTDMAALTGIPFARGLVAYRFASIEKMGLLDIPILLTHGDADEVVPFAMGEALRDAATRATTLEFLRVPGGDHGGSWVTGGHLYWDSWRRFLSSIVENPT